MFIKYGTGTAKIKTYTDQLQPCKSCRAFDRTIKVYQSYFHVWYIPFVAKPGKTALIRCNNCGEPVLTSVVLQEYENKTKTPFYFYSWPILIAVMVLSITIITINTEREKEKLVAQPQVGDVYSIKKSSSGPYYFLRLSKIKGDTIIAYQNNYMYYHTVSRFESNDDFFYTGEEFKFTQEGIQQMLNNNEIDAVYRGYDSSKGFNRIN